MNYLIRIALDALLDALEWLEKSEWRCFFCWSRRQEEREREMRELGFVTCCCFLNTTLTQIGSIEPIPSSNCTQMPPNGPP